MKRQEDRAAQKLGELCCEAVKRHGADWPRLEAFVRDRLHELSTKEQNEFWADLSKIAVFDSHLPTRAPPH